MPGLSSDLGPRGGISVQYLLTSFLVDRDRGEIRVLAWWVRLRRSNEEIGQKKCE